MNLIIGMGDDTPQNRHATFLRSIEKLGLDCEVQVFTHNPLPWHPVVDRWRLIADYISKGKYHYVIACDTFDVVFQRNPFQWLKEHLWKSDLVVVGEEKTFRECEGNKRGIMQSFPAFWESLKNQEVLNAGIIAGHAEFVGNLCQSIYNLCQQDVRLPEFTPGFEDRLPDQQSLNILYNRHCDMIAHGKDAWAFQYNHKHQFRDGRMYNENGELYAIFHQYVYGWKDEVHKVY